MKVNKLRRLRMKLISQFAARTTFHSHSWLGLFLSILPLATVHIEQVAAEFIARLKQITALLAYEIGIQIELGMHGVHMLLQQLIVIEEQIVLHAPVHIKLVGAWSLRT